MPILPKFPPKEPEKKKDEPIPLPEAERRDIYQVIGRYDLFRKTVDTILGTLPSFTHSIRVSVIGGPKSDIRRIWYLAASACLGKYRQGVTTTLSPLSVSTEWDITGKAVSIEIVYRTNRFVTTAGSKINVPTSNPVSFLMKGPDQLTIGASWQGLLKLDTVLNAKVVFDKNKYVTHSRPLWRAQLIQAGLCLRARTTAFVSVYAIVDRLPITGGLSLIGNATGGVAPGVAPASSGINVLREQPLGAAASAGTITVTGYPYRVTENLVGSTVSEPGISGTPDGTTVPDLPDDGRVITTVEKNDPRVQPPKPSLDGHTRFGLLALVAQSLQVPCYLPASAPCTNNDHGHSGLFLYDPGTQYGISAPLTILRNLWQTALPGTWPLSNNVGPDGYPLNTAIQNITTALPNPLSPF